MASLKQTILTTIAARSRFNTPRVVILKWISAHQQQPDYYRHPLAVVESPHVGAGTRIWAFAHVLPGAVIGRDCNICDHTFLENGVSVGDRVTVKCGVQLWDGVTLEDDVFIGPNATFANDKFPRSRRYDRPLLPTLVKRGASIGANATILPGITIGEQAMIGAGAVVTRDVPAHTVVTGNPGRITGYVGTAAPAVAEPGVAAPEPGVFDCRVAGVRIHRLPLVNDLRGSLTHGEIGRNLPFDVKRYFVVFGVPNREIRGEHAHRRLHQFLVCVHGDVHVVVDDGETREEVVLEHPTTGLHVPPLIWSVQYKYSPDAVLLVLASDIYRPEDYIRDYAEFQALRAEYPGSI